VVGKTVIVTIYFRESIVLGIALGGDGGDTVAARFFALACGFGGLDVRLWQNGTAVSAATQGGNAVKALPLRQY